MRATEIGQTEKHKITNQIAKLWAMRRHLWQTERFLNNHYEVCAVHKLLPHIEWLRLFHFVVVWLFAFIGTYCVKFGAELFGTMLYFSTEKIGTNYIASHQPCSTFSMVFFYSNVIHELSGYDRYGPPMYDRGYNRFGGRDPARDPVSDSFTFFSRFSVHMNVPTSKQI